MANFYKDNDDLQFYVDHAIDWGTLVALAEPDPDAPDAPKNTEEAVQSYKDMLEMIGKFVAEEVALLPALRLLSEQGWTIYRAEVREGKEHRALLPTGKWVLLLGNEGHGVSEELSQLGEAIHIAMTGAAESLNVAVAGAILLHGLTAVAGPQV